MKNKNPFCKLKKFELMLWTVSVFVVVCAFIVFQSSDILTLIASVIGVTALIFVAKGYVIGQIFTVIFAVFYGVISYFFHYYGEMITYLGMTAPIAVVSLISWIKHPYKETEEVEVSPLLKKQLFIMVILAAATTVTFYFILKALNNANLVFSTISVTTSFLASYLTACRSHFYALAYAANDMVLVVLWVLAAAADITYAPMVACFIMFLINDIYGFFNWQRMKRSQSVTAGCTGRLIDE